MFSMFKNEDPSVGDKKESKKEKIKESKVAVKEKSIMTKDAYLKHIISQIHSAKSMFVTMQLANQIPLYIGHKDLLAVTVGKDCRDNLFMELYASDLDFVEETLVRNGAVKKELMMIAPEYSPAGYCAYSYENDEIDSVVSALMKLKILTDVDKNEIEKARERFKNSHKLTL